jgi:hypothetical protein
MNVQYSNTKRNAKSTGYLLIKENRNNNLVSAHSGNDAVFDPMIRGGVAHVSLSNRHPMTSLSKFLLSISVLQLMILNPHVLSGIQLIISRVADLQCYASVLQ